MQNACGMLDRSESRGEQHYETNPDLYPLNKPLQKLDGLVQCTGEAKYVNDVPVQKDELHGAFVISNRARCQIANINLSEAMV